MRKFLKVGMDESLYNKSQQKAKDLNLTLSNYVRQLLENGKVVERVDNKKELYHLNKIGNNINQVAKKINSVKSYRTIDSKIYMMLLSIKENIYNMVFKINISHLGDVYNFFYICRIGMGKVAFLLVFK